jgi:hypothetical protein
MHEMRVVKKHITSKRIFQYTIQQVAESSLSKFNKINTFHYFPRGIFLRSEQTECELDYICNLVMILRNVSVLAPFCSLSAVLRHGESNTACFDFLHFTPCYQAIPSESCVFSITLQSFLLLTR